MKMETRLFDSSERLERFIHELRQEKSPLLHEVLRYLSDRQSQRASAALDREIDERMEEAEKRHQEILRCFDQEISKLTVKIEMVKFFGHFATFIGMDDLTAQKLRIYSKKLGKLRERLETLSSIGKEEQEENTNPHAAA